MIIRSAIKMHVQLIVALFLMGAAFGSVQAASIVTNGSFETEAPPGGNPDLAAGWTVDEAVAVRRANRGASEGDWAMLFGVGEQNTGAISQVLNIQQGVIYTLKFDLGMYWGAGTGPQNFQYKVTEIGGSGFGLRNETVTTENLTNTPLINNWETHTDGFISNTTNQVLLEFIDLSSGAGYDIALDNVSVDPVPLPPAAWLLGSALFGLLAVGKRKRQS